MTPWLQSRLDVTGKCGECGKKVGARGANCASGYSCPGSLRRAKEILEAGVDVHGDSIDVDRDDDGNPIDIDRAYRRMLEAIISGHRGGMRES